MLYESIPLGKVVELEKNKETLPAVEVDNEVVWINPSFKDTMPFSMEIGKRTGLGIFLHPGSPEKNFQVEVHPYHSRSAI